MTELEKIFEKFFRVHKERAERVLSRSAPICIKRFELKAHKERAERVLSRSTFIYIKRFELKAHKERAERVLSRSAPICIKRFELKAHKERAERVLSCSTSFLILKFLKGEREGKTFFKKFSPRTDSHLKKWGGAFPRHRPCKHNCHAPFWGTK